MGAEVAGDANQIEKGKFGRWREFCNWIDVTGETLYIRTQFRMAIVAENFHRIRASSLFFRIATRREYISSRTADVCNDIDIKSIKVGRRNLLKSLTKTRREMLL